MTDAWRCLLFLRLILVPRDREPFGCFEDPPVPLANRLCCSGPQRGLNSKNRWGVCRGPLGGSKHFEVNYC